MSYKGMYVTIETYAIKITVHCIRRLKSQSFLQIIKALALWRVARPKAQLAAALRLPLQRWGLQAWALAAQIGRSPLLHEDGLRRLKPS